MFNGRILLCRFDFFGWVKTILPRDPPEHVGNHVKAKID